MERRTLLGLARDAVRTVRRLGHWVGYLGTVDVLGKLADFTRSTPVFRNRANAVTSMYSSNTPFGLSPTMPG
jgi:hypothetical protein